MDGPEPFHWLGAPVAVYGQFVSRKKDALMTTSTAAHFDAYRLR